MIFLDFSQICLANIFRSTKMTDDVTVDIDLVRHMVLTSIKNYKQKFTKKYGELIICCDSWNVWRKQKYPHYKETRKITREKSSLDWNAIHKIINTLIEEFKENLPYKVLQVDNCETDDLISILTKEYIKNFNESILIISGDRDFVQLQKYGLVEQFDPIKKFFITSDDPKKSLIEKIICGDAGDGIPNILSKDDTFISSTRQKKITKDFLNTCLDKISENNDYSIIENMYQEHYLTRNRELIDFTFIPKEIEEKILDKYHSIEKNSIKKLHQYFLDKKLVKLYGTISQF